MTEPRASANGYVELHARSSFSFLHGASTPEEYVDLCQKLEIPGMALVDRDGFYGSPRFHMAAKRTGESVRAHIGAEVTCTDSAHYPLLVKTQQGYQNMCRMMTRMKLRTPKHPKPGHEAAATPEELKEFAQGLICLTGDADGPLAVALKQSPQAAQTCLERLLDTFGRGNVYVELQRHFCRDEEARNEAFIELARRCKVPLVATNGVCYAHPAQRQILDVFTCLHRKVTLETAGKLLARNSERYLKHGGTMERLFADLPEAIANTQEISSQLKFVMSELGYKFPPYPVPPGETMGSFLRKRVDEGARRRWQPYREDQRKQIEHELALIEKMELPGYFLIVWNIVQFCRKEGILAQGRGSAANSAVCYVLDITAVDPIKYNLLFARFLSEQRGEYPDIDIDLPSGDDRERVIQHVYRVYGQMGAAMTANVITYRGRSAVREAGKVLGFDTPTLETLSNLAPMWGWKNPADNIEKQFKEAGLDLANQRIRKFYELVHGIQDLPRHLGQHSGGMVVCMDRLDSVVPLEPASMPGRVVVQWDKEDCADMGIIKIDLLGLGMMAALRDTIYLVKRHYNEEVDLGQLPEKDDAVFKCLQQADTIGLFQVESRAQQASLPRTRPENFYDVAVQVAIIRPGPIVGKMMHPYLNRRQGKEKPECLHPSLEAVLKRTLGVPLFQEQLLRMAMIVADFTGSEAEELRRAMGFKRSEQRMKDIEKKLRDGMTRKGIVGDTQEKIVGSITSFALYGFPESHAISFALLAYASAYLKCHYLAAFTCALLNNQPMGFYHPAVLIKDAQRHGLRVLPPEINRSDWDCTLEGTLEDQDRHLRLGLRYAKGLRAETAAAIVAARPFSDVDDLANRVPKLQKNELALLASIGALNNIGAAHRRDALWKAGRAGRAAGPLLKCVPETAPSSPLRQMTIQERICADYQGTSVTVGRHPMAHRREEMNLLQVTPAARLNTIRSGKRVRVAGCIIVRQRPGTASGIVFISIEDETGISNVVVMPDLFEAQRRALVSQPYLLIEGQLQNVDGVIHVLAQRIVPLTTTMPALDSHDFK
jgi:error-prone DNA polymerase